MFSLTLDGIASVNSVVLAVFLSTAVASGAVMLALAPDAIDVVLSVVLAVFLSTAVASAHGGTTQSVPLRLPTGEPPCNTFIRHVCDGLCHDPACVPLIVA